MFLYLGAYRLIEWLNDIRACLSRRVHYPGLAPMVT
jgi:hypothetical protein